MWCSTHTVQIRNCIYGHCLRSTTRHVRIKTKIVKIPGETAGARTKRRLGFEGTVVGRRHKVKNEKTRMPEKLNFALLLTCRQTASEVLFLLYDQTFIFGRLRELDRFGGVHLSDKTRLCLRSVAIDTVFMSHVN